MKKIWSKTILMILVSLFLLSRCSPGVLSNSSENSIKSLLAISNIITYEEIAPITTAYNDPSLLGYCYKDIKIPEQTAGQNVSFDYTFDTKSNTKNIYFIFTNISPYGSSTYPLIDSNQSVSQSIIPETGDTTKSKLVLANIPDINGKPEISEFNRNPYAFLNKINPVNMLLNIVTTSEPKFDIAGGSTTFKIDAWSSLVAHCRNVTSSISTNNGNKTLNIWVADNCWGSGAPITQSLVNDLADNFLIAGSNNDIYDWVSNIFGAEYGDSDWDKVANDAKNVLITPKNEITILLLDIDNDKSTSSGVLGYFWAKDNFKQSAISYSNERIMIYLDAYIYANHPDWIISALTHELQHMIHFYQKTVIQTNGTGTETWIDEMCSMAAEDLVADKLGVDGPRGVSYLDGTAGTPPLTTLPITNKGRLPLYNYYNDASVTSWYSGNNVIISYSINYALGAYLFRNYGGVKFFHDVVHNPYTNYQAIEKVLQQNNPGDSFGDMLGRWGISNLISDKYNAPDGYKYNIDKWFTSDTDPATVEYQAGSINLYNYTYNYSTPSQVGPYFYTTMPSGTMPPASNEYFYAGSLTGQKTWNIKLRNNVRLTVMAK